MAAIYGKCKNGSHPRMIQNKILYHHAKFHAFIPNRTISSKTCNNEWGSFISSSHDFTQIQLEMGKCFQFQLTNWNQVMWYNLIKELHEIHSIALTQWTKMLMKIMVITWPCNLANGTGRFISWSHDFIPDSIRDVKMYPISIKQMESHNVIKADQRVTWNQFKC